MTYHFCKGDEITVGKPQEQIIKMKAMRYVLTWGDVRGEGGR